MPQCYGIILALNGPLSVPKHVGELIILPPSQFTAMAVCVSCHGVAATVNRLTLLLFLVSANETVSGHHGTGTACAVNQSAGAQTV